MIELRRHGLIYVGHTHKAASSYRIIRSTCEAVHGEYELENAAERYEQLRNSMRRQLAASSVKSVIIPWGIFLGEPYYQGHTGFYPKSPQSIGTLFRLFDGFSVRVIYTIRDQWGFVNSWYQQLQKMGRPVAPEIYREWAMTTDLSWGPIIANLRGAFGDGAVKVLHYSSPNILQRLLRAYGMPMNSIASAENTFKNKGWPSQAMKIAAFVMPMLTSTDIAQLRLLLDKGFEDHPAAAYRLLDEASRAEFSERYSEDMAFFEMVQR